MDKELEYLIKTTEARDILILLLSHENVDGLSIAIVEAHIKELDSKLEEARNGAKS